MIREIYVDEIDSSNSELCRIARAGGKESILLRVGRQSGGRGQKGRSFYSPQGGLYFSLLSFPSFPIQKQSWVACAAALALHRALKDCCGVETGIKWVNDLILGGRKISGILIEAGIGAERRWLVSGFGINLFGSMEQIPSELKTIMGYIFPSSPANSAQAEQEKLKVKLMHCIVDEYLKLLKELEGEELPPFLAEYRSLSILDGLKLPIIHADGSSEVEEIVEIDAEAMLVTRSADGRLKRYLNGEIALDSIYVALTQAKDQEKAKRNVI